MAWLATVFLAALIVAMLAHGFVTRGRVFTFPFLAAAIFLTFVLPQIPGLINDHFIDNGSVTSAVLFSALCLAACHVGWELGMRCPIGWDVALSEQRLLRSATVLSLVGAYFFNKFGHLPDEERLRGMLTGTSVAYLFFARLLTYGFVIAVLCYAGRPSRFALAIIAFGCVFYFDRIVIAGRRSELSEFGLILALAFWFQRRWSIPRVAVVAGIVASLVGLLGAEEYRNAIYYKGDSQWSDLANIDLEKNFNSLLENGGTEMRNLVANMEYASEAQEFDYGVSHWNNMVYTFVPAQIFGSDFKHSLELDVSVTFDRNHTAMLGSTEMGMWDAYGSFWYFGAVKFLIIGILLGWMYAAAMAGNTTMQALYMLSATPSMLTITHFTNEIVIAWVHILAFLAPVAIYASWGTLVRTQARGRAVA